MRQAVADVIEFMRAMGQAVPEKPESPDRAVMDLRIDLIKEEFHELEWAIEERDLPGVADACADLIYVTIGTAIAYGIDLSEVWQRVQDSNMAKTGGPVREDGKRLKPEGWQPPDIAGALATQRPLSEIYRYGFYSPADTGIDWDMDEQA